MADIKIREEKTLFEGYARLKQFSFARKKKNGDWEEQKREVFQPRDAAVILLYNATKQTVLLLSQFRLATYVNGNETGMLTEACAGLLEEGEAPDKTIRREVEEETGYVVDHVQKVCTAFSSPGAFSEKIHYFVAPYTDAQKRSAGGGLEEEGEELNIMEVPFEKALEGIKNGEIIDAKTILLLLYIQANNLMAG